MHLAVLREPFLGLMLSVRQTLESRFSRNRIAPYRGIRAVGAVLLKVDDQINRNDGGRRGSGSFEGTVISMAHSKCVTCRARAWGEGDPADHLRDLCPACGRPLEPSTAVADVGAAR